MKFYHQSRIPKINNYTYQFTFRGALNTVSDEELKTMRIRYIVEHNKEAKAYLRANNPEGSIWHKLGSL